MPELPEVETIVRDLKKKVLERTFVDIWTDFPKMIKKPEDFKDFKKKVINKKIKDIRRRAKFILFHLSGDRTLLVHQKLTGHFLLGKWKKENNKWKAPSGFLSEKVNTYIHLLFTLDNKEMLALSDLRKFAKVELWNSEELKKELIFLGPEPLDKNFTFEKFKETLLKRKKGKIKQILMNQAVIAGIGNIYSDEILWEAKVNPFKDVLKLSQIELKKIYGSLQKILKRAIRLKGESISDFRRVSGEKGAFDPLRKVYRREGEKCSRCGAIILRKKIGGRSAHFCPQCQKAKRTSFSS